MRDRAALVSEAQALAVRVQCFARRRGISYPDLCWATATIAALAKVTDPAAAWGTSRNHLATTICGPSAVSSQSAEGGADSQPPVIPVRGVTRTASRLPGPVVKRRRGAPGEKAESRARQSLTATPRKD